MKKFILFSAFTLAGVTFGLSQPTWQNIGPGGGSDLHFMAIQPDNANVVYVSGDIEGIFKTTDGGNTWANINNNLAHSRWGGDIYWTNDITIDPVNYQRVYVGTGKGLVRSDNGGQSWSLILPDTLTNNNLAENYPFNVSAIAIDSSNTNRLFAGLGDGAAGANTDFMDFPQYAGKTGMFRSLNGGATWDTLNTGIPDSTMIFSIVINRINPNQVITSTSRGVFRSDDGGNTWSVKNTGLPHLNPHDIIGVRNGAGFDLYLSMKAIGTSFDSASYSGGIFKSLNMGDTWTDISGDLPVYEPVEGLFYEFWKIDVNRSNPSTIIAGTVRGSGQEVAGIYRTNDGGASWVLLYTPKNNGWLDSVFAYEPHVFDIKIAPSDTSRVYSCLLYVERSDDGGVTWQQKYTTANAGGWIGGGLELMNSENIAFHPTDSNIYYVCYDDMGFFRTDNNGQSYMRLDTGQAWPIGNVIADGVKEARIDPANGDIYASRFGGSQGGWGNNFLDGGIIFSNNMGAGFSDISPAGINGRCDLALDITSGTPGNRTLYAAIYNNGVYKSTNSGTSWITVNTGLGGNETNAWEIAIDPGNIQTLYFGTITLGGGTKGLFKSTDGGANWNLLNNFPAGDVTYVNVFNNVVYAAITDNFAKPQSHSGGLYKSLDGGTTWTEILDVNRCLDLDISPFNDSALVAVNGPSFNTDSIPPALYMSTDGGQTWQIISDAINHTDFNFVRFDKYNPQELFAGTGGGGIWRTTNLGISGGGGGGTLTANFTFSGACLNDSTVFTDASTAGSGGPIDWWEWDFGDSTGYDSVQNPVYTFADTGTFNVMLVAGDSAGGADTIIKSVSIIDCSPPPSTGPSAGFTVDSTCLGSTTQFTDTSVAGTGGPIEYWEWDFGDSTGYDSVPNPVYAYADTGSYNVMLVVTDSLGASDTALITVDIIECIPAVLTANFEWADTCSGDSTYFNDLSLEGSNGPVTDWYWDFGDGNTSTDTLPVHVYTASGTYNVMLVVSDSSGDSDTAIKTIVIGNCNCFADWYYDRDNQTVYFANFSEATGTTTYQWNFGDASTSTAKNPVHTYASNGAYFTCLTLTDSLGCTSALCDTVFVGIPGYNSCWVDWNYFPDSLDVYFNDGSSSDITSWQWNFGDATTSTEQYPLHTYSTPGTYYVCLTVGNGAGCTQTWCDSVVAGGKAKCNANFNAYTDTSTTVYFTNMSSGDIAWYYWDFGDSATSSDENPANTYTAAGSYWVCLTVGDTVDCESTQCILIDVGTPTCDISISSSVTDVICYGGINGQISITASGGKTPYAYSWSNGGVASSISGLTAGTYSVTVTGFGGCTATSAVTVTQPGAITLSFTSTNSNCGGSDGTATVTPSGGNAPYTYSWSNGQTDSTATNFAAGTVSVTVEDNFGCPSTGSVQISDNAGISLSATVTNVSGCNGNTNGSINLTAAGGTGSLSYAWSNTYTGEDPSGLGAGNYSVTVSDSLGCMSAGSYSVTEPAGISLAISSTGANCASANGSATVTATGGAGSYSYLWDNAATTSTITGITAGNYSVTVTDANSCTAQATATVSNLGAVNVIVDAINNVSCAGGSDGSIMISTSGGMPPFFYNWSSGTYNQDATGLAAGTYFVIITGSNGCMTIRSYTVTQPPPLTASATATSATCGNSDGSAAVSANGGTPPYTYNWSSGGNQATETGLSAGTYTVTITDSEGCTAIASASSTVAAASQQVCVVTVDSATNKNLVAWEKTPELATKGFNIYKEVSLNVYDSIGYVPFDSLSMFVDYASDPKTKSERYKVATVDSCGNLSALSTAHRTMHMTANVGINDERNLIWDNYEGFVFGLYRIWRGTSDTNIVVIDSIVSSSNTYSDWDTLSGVDSLFYLIEVVHPTGCTSTVKIKSYNSSKSNTASMEAPGPQCFLVIDSLTMTKASCADTTCTDGSASVYPSGGTGTLTYLWSNGGNTGTIAGLYSATYMVTITDSNGCTTTGSVLVDFLVSELNGLPVTGYRLLVYPNPVRDVLYVKIESSDAAVKEMRLVNILGQVIFQSATTIPQSAISLTGVPEGIYRLVIITDGGTFGENVVIER